MRLSYIIFLGFTLVTVLSIIVSVVNYKLANEVSRNSNFLTNSEAIIRNSSQLHKDMLEMQSGFRGYLLTGNDHFLLSYKVGLIEVPPLLEEEKKLIANVPVQKQRLAQIIKLHEEWIKYSSRIINAKVKTVDTLTEKEYKYLFDNHLQKEVGKKINDQISEIFNEFDKYEYYNRQIRRNNLNDSITTSQNASLILAWVIMVLGVICALYIARVISIRIHHMVHLADIIAKGEFTDIKDEANDELTDLSHSLNIMSSKLKKSFSALESKNKELDQFAYVVSHDLKAPLRGLYHILHWIEEDHTEELSPQITKYLGMMRGRVQRLESLISGLLEYARIGRTVKQIDAVDINELLAEVKEMVPVGFKVVIPKKMPVLNAEKIRLEQVFTNLISNAFKYHPKKEGTITIDYQSLERCYEFSVKDDGAGIAPEYHKRIFDIFQTLRQKNELESTGIGLAIVKKIIEDQKGEIRVVSELGKGATFIFTWPKEPNI
ncbi:MAG TPA: ATP-binding protein [Cytophagales bacterium]|nr:ATP-binding protein [Cytophagales bacterium]